VPTEAETINATVTNIIDRDTAYNSFLKLPSAGLRGSNGKNISRIGNGAYLWARSPASTDGEFDARYFMADGKARNRNDGSGFYPINRTYGLSIRCIQRKN
jgi:hypothetical protein